MTRPFVSIIVETVNPRFVAPESALPDQLAATIASIEQQTYPADRIETFVVIDDEVSRSTETELRERYPGVTFVKSAKRNYFEAKNAGAAVANGELIAMLDGDCVGNRDWLDTLISRFDDPTVDAVAGRTRYSGPSMTARTFSIPDFGYVHGKENDAATGFNINNVAFRRAVILEHPFDSRIRRNGGCYFLFHQLRVAGKRIVYEPNAIVAHGLDFHGLGFIRKHFDRGYDGVAVYRLDEQGVLRGTRFIRKAGPFALLLITLRRIGVDWLRMLRHRRQIGISPFALPYYLGVTVTTRTIELAGGLTAMFAPARAES